MCSFNHVQASNTGALVIQPVRDVCVMNPVGDNQMGDRPDLLDQRLQVGMIGRGRMQPDCAVIQPHNCGPCGERQPVKADDRTMNDPDIGSHGFKNIERRIGWAAR